ncbi:MAG: TonB-dependent siderophore receptor [Burkholderiaceae bacterium]
MTLVLAMILGVPGWAQSQTVIDDKPIAISIAAKPLGDALHELSRSTGVPIAFAPSLVAGKTAPAVTGTLTARQALTQLMVGSGLEAEQDGASIVIRASTPKSSESSLPAVKVIGQLERDGTTEGSGSYRALYTNTATKFDLSPRETPQTVTTITRQQMDDFSMTSVDDALETTSGVFVYKQALLGNGYYSRGFTMQTQYDGMLNPIGINNQYAAQVDNAFLDRVEVLQGASGLLAGAGNPGGTINLIRKRPTDNFQAHTEVQIGSWNHRRFIGDISGPLVESGQIKARLVALADDTDSFVNYVYNKRIGIYGAIEANISSSTKLSASIQYQSDKTNNSAGVPLAEDGSDLGLSRSNFFGDPREIYTKEYTLYTLSLEQKLSNNWKAKLSYNHQNAPTKAIGYNFLFGPANRITGDGPSIYGGSNYATRTSSDAIDGYIIGSFSAFDRKNELVLGFNSSDYKNPYGGSGYSDGTPINVYTFNPASLSAFQSSWAYSGNDHIRQIGAYAVGRFALADNLKLILGSRVSWYTTSSTYTYIDVSGPQPSQSDQKKNGVVSPYAGIVYDVSDNTSIYASYSDIFNPQNNKNINGNYLKPVVGSNYEIGIKGDLFSRKINYSAALFRLDQANLASIDNSSTPDQIIICGGTCYTAADKVQSQGIDLGINGEISRGWNLAASYTYVSSKYSSGDQQGQRFMTSLPRNSLRLATIYKVPQTDLSIGGDIRAFSRIYKTDNETYYINRGKLALVGLVAKYYITPKTDLTLRVDNIFDKRYYSTVAGLNYSSFGEPRRVSLNLKYHF